ncbi:hypothetical protein QUB63_18270 [Microcoleus sp. ARI1-B5]|uniref:hypothetical protein n=1 Tax=unclassified Microcoleus TaxID=2642155 RepID=UPI002FD46519
MFDALKSWLSSLTPTQLQTYQPLFYILFGLITIFFGVVNVSKIIYDWNKDKIKITIKLKRDSVSLPAIQQPLRNYLLIEVVNKGYKDVIINEIGIAVPGKNDINVVDMPWTFPILKGYEKEIMGSLEWVALPGTVNPQSIGIAQILFSNLEEAYKNIKKEKELSLEEPGYLRTRNLINAYEELMKSYNTTTQVLTVKPYTVTTTGQRFNGKKTKIQLGNLHTAVQATTQKKRFL